VANACCVVCNASVAGDTKLAKKPSLEHLVPEGHDGLGLGPGAAAGMDEYYDDFNTDSSQEINSSATSFTRQRTFNRMCVQPGLPCTMPAWAVAGTCQPVSFGYVASVASLLALRGLGWRLVG
jgi:hypothetical protein